MFVLEAMDLSLRSGISPNRIPEAIANRFSFHLESRNRMDNRVSIRISPRQIRFFYYDHDYPDKKETGNKYNPNGIKDNSFVREVGTISLTHRKDTGNDILAFPQNINDLDLLDEKVNGELKETAEEINECNMNWKTKFHGFPFAAKSGYNEEKPEENLHEAFRTFLRYCLLCFVYEFEDRGMAFGGSPIYDVVRDKLRESDVYNVLSAKLHYTMYLYDGKHYSRNQEKYTYYTRKFTEYLMNKRLNEVIPSDNYNSFKEGQGWFNNPEEELEQILERNRQHKCEGGSILKEVLVSKIRRYMYSQHAIDRAMTTCCGKCLFWVAQVFMLLWSVAMVSSSAYLYSGKWNWFYEDYWLIIIGGTIVVLVIISGMIERINVIDVINTTLPRIIVAEATAWLTVGFASIVLNGMPWIIAKDTIFTTSIAVLIVVGALVFGKSKQHSPYYKRGENITKALLIMNHSFFFALALGCIFRFCFYDNLLRTNNVLSQENYREHFDAVNKHLQRLEDMEKSINEYCTFARDPKQYDEYDNHNAIVKNIKRVAGETGVFDFMLFACSIDTIVLTNGVNTICKNVSLINRITPNLIIEIRETKDYLTDICEEPLPDWAAVNYKNNKYTNSEYVNDLIRDAEKQKCSILVGDKQLYPALLVFHALIVLVLAFVTQLFISDKAITEPL